MAGIIRYGSYVPFFRLQRRALGGGRGERAVASYDEDAVSMAVEAGREALRGAPEVHGLLLATTSPPYAEKLNAATVHAALNLPPGRIAADLGGSTRAGLAGVLLAADVAASGRRMLVCASDVVVPRQLAMYLARRYTHATLQRIGEALGRDHPAVSHALAVVERQILERAPLRYQVEALAARLDALAGRGAPAPG